MPASEGDHAVHGYGSTRFGRARRTAARLAAASVMLAATLVGLPADSRRRRRATSRPVRLSHHPGRHRRRLRRTTRWWSPPAPTTSTSTSRARPSRSGVSSGRPRPRSTATGVAHVVRFHSGEGRASILRGFDHHPRPRRVHPFRDHHRRRWHRASRTRPRRSSGTSSPATTPGPTPAPASASTRDRRSSRATTSIDNHTGTQRRRGRHLRRRECGDREQPHRAATRPAAGGGALAVRTGALHRQPGRRATRPGSYDGGGVSVGPRASPSRPERDRRRTVPSVRGGGVGVGQHRRGRPPEIVNNTIDRQLGSRVGSALAGGDGGAVVVNNIVVGVGAGTTVECFGTAVQLAVLSHNNVYRGRRGRRTPAALTPPAPSATSRPIPSSRTRPARSPAPTPPTACEQTSPPSTPATTGCHAARRPTSSRRAPGDRRRRRRDAR